VVAVQLRRSQLEAAARLWMGEDFDGNQLDALFICLEVCVTPARMSRICLRFLGNRVREWMLSHLS
jgi:hypothetical protein